MTPDATPRMDDDSFAEALAEYDDALAAGQVNANSGLENPGVSAERLRRAQACLALIAQVRRFSPNTPRTDGSIDDTPWNVSHPAGAPERIGRFRIVRELGRGGFGVVFLAEDPELGRQVALKVPRLDALLAADLQKRFLREAKAAAGLSHPSIVPVFEAGAVAGLAYIAYAYCDGLPLSQWLRSQSEPVEPSTAAAFVATLADAVQHAHSRGILHRDLKPANILLQKSEVRSQKPAVSDRSRLTSDFWPMITDFGLAKFVESTDADVTQTGAVLGTPAYMSPEQAEGKLADISPATDIFALGAILYEMLTGAPPFRGESNLAVLDAVRHHEPARMRGVPRDVEAICRKCLEKQPHRRYRNALALADDLQRFVAGVPVQARPVSQSEHFRRWCRRKPLLASLVGLTFATLVVVATLAVVIAVRESRFADREFRAAQDLREEQKRTQNQLERAEGNFAWSQEAVDELLSQVSEELQDVPQLDGVRRQLLQKALRLHLEFLRSRAADPVVRLDAARAYRRSAEIHTLLGDRGAAEAALKSALELFASGTDDSRSVVINDVEYAAAWHQLGRLHAGKQQYRDAEDCYRKALQLLERPLADASCTQPIRNRAATGWQALGIVMELTHRFEDAEAAYRKALAFVENLGPDEIEGRARRAEALNSLAILSRKWGRPEQAESAYREALEVWESAIVASPNRRLYRERLADVYGNLGNLYLSPSNVRISAAYDSYSQQLKLYQQLVRDFPAAPKYRQRLAGSHLGMGYLFMRSEYQAPFRAATLLAFEPRLPLTALAPLYLPPEAPIRRALDAYGQALAIQTELVEQYGESPAYMQELAKIHSNIGRACMNLRRSEEASAALEASCAIFDDLFARFPNNPDYLSGRAIAVGNRASHARIEKRYSEAILHYRDALKSHRAAVDRNPRYVNYQHAWRTELRFLCETLLESGDHAAAAKDAEAFLRFANDGGQGCLPAANILVRCIAEAGNDPALDADGMSQARAAYGHRAVQVIQQALAETPTIADAVRKSIRENPLFAPLREHAEIQALLK